MYKLYRQEFKVPLRLIYLIMGFFTVCTTTFAAGYFSNFVFAGFSITAESLILWIIMTSAISVISLFSILSSFRTVFPLILLEKGLCPKCGYDWGKCNSWRCSECGTLKPTIFFGKIGK